MPTREIPNLERLTSGLSAVFRRPESLLGKVRVLDRKPNLEESTFPTEIVKCALDAKGRTLRLFVKYGTKEFNSVFGHRGNVSYEAKVYREVLQPLHISTPNFYGVYRDRATHAQWLVIEFLEGSRGHWSRNPDAMIASARWIGKFHAFNEERVSSPELNFLRRYDRNYYLGWARRASRLASSPQTSLLWLSNLCDRFEMLLPDLMESTTLTVIHGEYYSNNTIYQDGTCSPVDWQSAAVAAGEIDLASLTQSRPSQIVKKCERVYSKSRWPNGPPEDFKQTLEAARVYINLRWLGDPGLMSRLFGRGGEFIPSEKFRKMIKGIYSAGKRTGLI